jgi:hypothetical protein
MRQTRQHTANDDLVTEAELIEFGFNVAAVAV